MDDLVCPRCKTTKYRNPYLKLLVNICGHALCDSCIELLFVKGSAACPECSVPLRRGGFRLQLFEDPTVEKEVDIRRRLLKDFSKTEIDFSTLREYNDYLEEVETIIFNLVNNIDILETNKKIEQYKKDNREQILKSKARLHPHLLELEEILEKEKLIYEQGRYEAATLEREEKLLKIKTKESLIDELMFSDTTADDIIATHKIKIEKDILENKKAAEIASKKAISDIIKRGGHTSSSSSSDPLGLGQGQNVSIRSSIGRPQFSTGISAGGLSLMGSLHSIPKKDDTPLYKYIEPIYNINGPHVPTYEELLRSNSSTNGYNYLANIKIETISEKAGGFHSSLACRRALQEAYSDITFKPRDMGIKYNENEYENVSTHSSSSNNNTMDAMDTTN